MKTFNYSFQSMEANFGDATIRFYKVGNENKKDPEEQIEICHSHLCYEIHIVTKGEYSYAVNGESIVVHENNMLIVPPNTEHDSVIMGKETEFAIISLNIEPTSGDAGFYCCFTDSLNNSACKSIPVSNKLCEFFKIYCSSDFVNSIEEYCKAKLLAYEIAVELFDTINGFECGTYKQRQKSENFEAMLEALVNKWEIPLSDISKKLGYSERQLSRKIKECYGMSLTEVRRKKMLITARKLLKKGELSMTAVARKSGFKSVSTLKKALGEK